MQEKKKTFSMLFQVTLLFFVGVLLIGVLSSITLYAYSMKSVNSQIAESAAETTSNLKHYIEGFPAHDWLLRYWDENTDQLDIEYDVNYTADTETAEKCRQLVDRHPDFQLQYATEQDVKALPTRDQKLYAEIVYSWLITHINNVAVDYDISFLSCVITQKPYDKQRFLFIASAKDRDRGTGHGELYPIGTEIGVSDYQQAAMKSAVAGFPQIAKNQDGKYYDFYLSIASLDGHEYLIGLTRNVKTIKESIFGYAFSHSFLTVLFLIVMAVVCLVMILVAILRPLKKVQDNIRLFRDTKDSATVIDNLAKIKSRNEIAELSDDVAELAKEIDDYTTEIKNITSERERIAAELILANRIQSAMLPTDFSRYSDRKEFEIFGSMDPARDIGGDFYDFFLVDEDHLCLLIADVSGKGIPAALFMMSSNISLSNHVKAGISPAQILQETNKVIYEHNPEEMFVTVWLGILDLKTGKLTASNAGHEFPILKQPNQPFELIKDKHSFVIGGMAKTHYKEYELQMQPGSKLFLYTDGLPEASNENMKMFKIGHVLKELNRNPDLSPKETILNMKSAVNDFVKDTEQFDDLTMLCLTYHGPSADA